MKTISYVESEKRLFDLNKVANIKENVYLTALTFALQQDNKFINNVNFAIYILFRDEVQLDFDHNDTDKYCKIEIRSREKEVVLTAFFYKNKDSYPVIEDIHIDNIFAEVEKFFK